MPIVVKDFTWTQSELLVCINLPLKGTKSSNIDIVNSLEFCKVSYPPFYFECWFHDNIVDENVSAIINNGIIALKFKKATEGMWPSLFHPDSENKELLKKIRENAIQFEKERAERLAKKKADDINENKKIALKEQMKIEEEQRKKIEKIKEEERQKVNKELEKLKELKGIASNPIQVNEEVKPEDKTSTIPKSIFNENEQPIPKTIEKPLPLPRSNGTIEIKFTPRVFPTPSRESQSAQEKEWLENQANARKMTDLDEYKDLTADEKNLDWLKDKANNFFKQGDFQAAIGVYNHAAKLFPKLSLVYSNRAACHFKVRNFIKCVEDCTRALDLLTPPVPENKSSRIKAHIRRGTAFCELELYAEGLLDYEAALKLDPSNADLISDAENIRKIITGSSDNDQFSSIN